MASISWSALWWGRREKLVLFWISTIVPLSIQQPPLPLSLPVHMSVIPPSWRFLPLSQAELGPLFSNSSPFFLSKSVFMLPPPGQAPRPGLRASFGPYSATQLLSDPVFLTSFPLSASLLSENVERERDMGGQQRFLVRVLFHKQGDITTMGTCITLHAFKETEERRATCIPQPPLGLCIVTLTLPGNWFEDDERSHQFGGDLDMSYRSNHPGRRVQKRRHHHYANLSSHRHVTSLPRNHPGDDVNTLREAPLGLRYKLSPKKNQVQLYYSSFDTVADLKLTPSGCMHDGASQSQSQLFHIKSVTLKEQQEDRETRMQADTCLSRQEGEELSVDSHVVIRYHKGPVLIGQPIKVSVNLRANFTAQLVVIRLRMQKGLVSMVAQRTLTSDLWAVTLERTQSAEHEIMSIFCHKHRLQTEAHDPTVLQQVVCLSTDGLKQSFGVAMTVSADWWVEYSGHKNVAPPHGAAVSTFSFSDRQIIGIAPITESNTIINTAILTNQMVSLPVIVLAIGHEEKVTDVTTAVTCHSTNENTVKVSSDCSTLYVDGSESGLGSTCALVEFHLGVLKGSVCLNVWAPSVPLRVLLADPVLNAIDGWNIFIDSRCEPVYQRSPVQVLTQFRAQDSHRRTTYLLGSSDWFMDVTELVHDWLRLEDPQVATISPQNIVIGLRPGKTSLLVISEQWDGVLGRCDITVTPDTVAAGDLSVQVVGGLGMSVTANPVHPLIVEATVAASNILFNQHQEASISIWLQFDDNTASLLSTFRDLPFFLHLSSLAETVVVVTHSPGQHILAQGDGGGPLLQAELLVSHCDEETITSTSIREEGGERLESKEGGSKRLARGSGWVRVNLDLGLLQPVGKTDVEDKEFELDISDMLVESDSNIYTSTEDDNEIVSTNGDYYGKLRSRITNRKWDTVGSEGIVGHNTLERAVLLPNLKEGTLYFSPSLDREKKRSAAGENKGWEIQDLEIGMVTVLSLLCLTALLFLVNCLPCALRGIKRSGIEMEREADPKRNTMDDEEEQEKEELKDWKPERKDSQGEDEQKQEDNTTESVQEVEIIC